MEFSELNLHPDLQRGLDDAGYITCMPVQQEVLRHAFSGQDLYVQSQTGTGKTAAFLVVIFQRLLTEDMIHGKKAIIMVPTRELAVQVEEEAKVIGRYLPFKIGSFFGGVGYNQQTALLRDNVQILVGTPGRVLDLNQSGHMNLMEIAFLVLDEADRMFDMGFYPDLRKLIRAVPPVDRRQTMLFSATLNTWVKNLAWEYTRNPFEIAIEPETVTVEEVEQVLYHVSSTDKMKLLLGIIKSEDPESILVFCNTKRYAEIVAKRLRLNGLECEYIMGDLPQIKRLRIIDDIKAGKLRILVATDVAARGLDIEGLAMVVNYDLPNESENYVHRIGRTARAGKTGKAFSFASEQDVYALPGIERYIGQKIPPKTVSGDLFAVDKSEGKHIHTEYYEEQKSRGGDSFSRGPRGRHRDGKDRRRQGDNRDSRERGREKIRTGEKAGPEPKLSELSLEERMAYYRQKYDKSGVSRIKQKGPDQKKANSPLNEKSAAGPETEEKRRRKDRVRRKGKPQKFAGAGQGTEHSPNAETAKPPNVEVQTLEKKGILSRFFAIFKKKPADSP